MIIWLSFAAHVDVMPLTLIEIENKNRYSLTYIIFELSCKVTRDQNEGLFYLWKTKNRAHLAFLYNIEKSKKSERPWTQQSHTPVPTLLYIYFTRTVVSQYNNYYQILVLSSSTITGPPCLDASRPMLSLAGEPVPAWKRPLTILLPS